MVLSGIPLIDTLLKGIAILVVVFLATRVVVLWYWKIDKIENLLTKIEENIRRDNQQG